MGGVGDFRILLLVVLCLLAAPLVSAATLSDVGLYWNDHPVQTLAPNTALSGAEIRFSVQGEEFDCDNIRCRAVLETDDFATPATKEIDLSDCVENRTAHRFDCVVPVTLSTDNETLGYTFAVFAGSARVILEESAFSVIIDETRPELVSLKTGFCQDSLCFIGSSAETQVTATFQDDISAFEYELVKFKVGTEQGHADSCSGMSCSATLLSPFCTEGQAVPIEVVDYGRVGSQVIPSSEDALNPVSASLTINAKCDAHPPVITDFSVVSQGVIPVVFETGAPLAMHATLTDMPEGRVTVFVDTTGLSDSDNVSESCAEGDPGTYECSITIDQLLHGEHKVDFVFRDGVGNHVTKSITINVLQSTTPPENLDLFTTTIEKITPDPLNRVALQLATQNNIQYPVLIDFSLAKKKSNARVSRIDITGMSCTWAATQANLTNSSHTNLFDTSRSYILRPDSDGENRFTMNFGVDAAELPATVFAHCTYALWVSDGNRFYSEPEEESFLLELHFKNAVLGQPGQEFIDEIKREEGKLNSGYGRTLEKLNRVGATLDEICSVYDVLNYGTQAGITIEAVGAAIAASGIGAGIGEGIAQIGAKVVAPFFIIKSLISDQSGNEADKQMLAQEMPTMTPSARLEMGQLLKADTDASDSFGWLRKTCDYYNCYRTAKVLPKLQQTCGDFNDWWSGDTAEGSSIGTTTIGGTQLSDLTGDLCAPSYDKSMLASLGLTGGGLCIKGILYNMNKWQGVHCGYVSCLKEQSLHGANIEVCKEAKQYKECMNVYDEVFELPIINVFTRSASVLNNLVQNLPMAAIQVMSNAACKPGTATANGVIQDVTTKVVNQVTGSALSAIRFMRSILAKLGLVKKAAAATDAATDTVGGPLPTAIGNFFTCHLPRAIVQVSDFMALQSGAPALTIDFNKENELCQAALCNEDEIESGNCNRGTSYIGWIEDVKYLRQQAYRMRLEYNQKYAKSDALLKLITTANSNKLESVYSSACQQSNGNTACSKKEVKKFRKEYEKLVDEYTAWKQAQLAVNANADWSTFLEEKNNNGESCGSVDCPDYVALNKKLLEYSQEQGDDYEYLAAAVRACRGSTDEWCKDLTEATITSCLNGDNPTKCFESNGLDKRSIENHFAESGITPGVEIDLDQMANQDPNVQSALYSLTTCELEYDSISEPPCSQFVTEYRVALENAKDNICKNDNGISCAKDAQGNLIGTVDYDSLTQDKLKENKEYSQALQDLEKAKKACEEGDDNACKSISEKTTAVTTACTAAANNVVSGSRNFKCVMEDGTIAIYDGNTKLIVGDRSAKEIALQEYNDRLAKYNKVSQLAATFVAKWLRDKGYLDNLKLSSWGDWGENIAREANKILNPEEWKANLCSGSIDINPDDEPLIEYSDGVGPALTFAAEKRVLNTTNNTIIYSISYYVRTDDDSDEYTVKVVFNPGGATLINGTTQASSEGVEIAPGDILQEATAFTDTRDFTEMCLVFDKRFPDYTGEERFCRSIVEDAYNRGESAEGDTSVIGGGS